MHNGMKYKCATQQCHINKQMPGTKNNNIPQLINKVRCSMFNFAAHHGFLTNN